MRRVFSTRSSDRERRICNPDSSLVIGALESLASHSLLLWDHSNDENHGRVERWGGPEESSSEEESAAFS